MDLQPLLDELGIDKMPPEQQAAFIGRTLALLQDRISLRMARQLSDDQVGQLEAALKDGDEAAMAALEREYPDFKKVCQEEVDDLKDELKALL